MQAAREGQQIPEVIWSQFRRAGLVSGHVPIGNQILGWFCMGNEKDARASMRIEEVEDGQRNKGGMKLTEGTGIKEGWGGRYLS